MIKNVIITIYVSSKEGKILVIRKAFKEEAVPICFAANNNFLPFTGVMIQSIIDNANSNDKYDIIVLCSDAEEELKKKMLSLANKKKTFL